MTTFIAVFIKHIDNKNHAVANAPRYTFNTETDVKEGDVILSSHYKDQVLCVSIVPHSFTHYNLATKKLANDPGENDRVVPLRVLDTTPITDEKKFGLVANVKI